MAARRFDCLAPFRSLQKNHPPVRARINDRGTWIRRIILQLIRQLQLRQLPLAALDELSIAAENLV
jgi:hypothetical protein